MVVEIEYKRVQKDGKKYVLLTPFSYYSKRYDKGIHLPKGYRSDGATGATDLYSKAWWVHDKLSDTGLFDDGSKCNNWQCSRILADILWEEGHKFRSGYWLFATWLFGGGKARENGMV